MIRTNFLKITWQDDNENLTLKHVVLNQEEEKSMLEMSTECFIHLIPVATIQKILNEKPCIGG